MKEIKKKSKTKKYMAFGILAFFALALVSAVVINELSNKAVVDMEVTSAMGVSFPGAGEELTLLPTTAMSTFEFDLLVENHANNDIIAPVLEITVSDGQWTTSCEDLVSVEFTDTWCTGEETNTCPVQDLATYGGVCDDSTGKAVYTIPTEMYKDGQSTTYPITATFGNVEANTYTITAEMLVA